MRKTVLILYSPLKDSALSFGDEKYQASYERLYTIAKGAGVALYRAPFAWYDPVRNTFAQAWGYADGHWKLSRDIRPDSIYDKTSSNRSSELDRIRLAEHFPLYNDPEFTRVAGNKYLTSQLVPAYFKPYTRIEDPASLEKALAEFPNDRLVVLKPELGSGGRGVFIGPAGEVLKQSLLFPLLLQEFIDGRGGVPGVAAGLHDLRVVYINEAPVYSYVRTPAKGKWLANVAQGGTMTVVPVDRLPASIAAAAGDVHRAFSSFQKKIYTIDFIFDADQRPWIVELNTMPGVYFEPGQEMIRDDFYRQLVEELKTIG